MDYKEKYENGVECIQEILGGAGDSIKVSILRKRLQPFFPELRESEDEKIRKELCDFLRDNMLHQDAQYFISWLEKQGEKTTDKIEPNPAWSEEDEEILKWLCRIIHSQRLSKEITLKEESELGEWMDKWLNHNPQTKQDEKKPIFNADDWYVSKVDGKIHNAKFIEKQDGEKPADKTESKFKVGNWFVNNISKNVFLIKSIDANGYCTLEDIKGNIISPCLPPCESDSHLWTIEDAKEGDVLVDEDNNIGIYVGKKDDFWHSCIYLGCDSCLRKIGGYHKCNNTKPATKEQRDLLFQKMEEAGCKWDSAYKKLAMR